MKQEVVKSQQEVTLQNKGLILEKEIKAEPLAIQMYNDRPNWNLQI